MVSTLEESTYSLVIHTLIAKGDVLDLRNTSLNFLSSENPHSVVNIFDAGITATILFL